MAQRADARRNREALLAAAEEVFADEGAGVPLDLVARRAGVGRGTLYRHFADRQALAFAVYERRLAGLEDLADAHRGEADLLERVTLAVAERQTRVPGLVGVLRATPTGEELLERITTRTRRLVSGPLAAAQASGTVRTDVTVDDLILLFAMVDGLLQNLPTGEATAAVARGCLLVLDGLAGPRPGAGRGAPSSPSTADG